MQAAMRSKSSLFSLLLLSLISYFLLFLTPNIALSEEIYQWVDGEGVPNFSEKRPETGSDIDEDSITSISIRNNANPELNTESDGEDSDISKEREEELLKKLANIKNDARDGRKKKRMEDCKRLRDTYKQFVNNTKVKLKSADGSIKHLSDKEREEKIANTEKNLVKRCSDVLN